MRHFLVAGAIARLARGVVEPAATTVLISLPGRVQRGASRAPRTGVGAVPVAAIAVTAQEKDAAAVKPRADDKPKRVQAPPRSGGRAGHARGDMRSREAPSRAPTGDSARGPGVCETPGPHPVTRRRRASSTSAQADPASRSGQIHAVFNVHRQSWCKRCGSTPRARRARRRKRRACATACSRWPYGSSAPSGASSCTSPRRSPGSRRGARLPAPSAPRPDALRHGACLTPAAVSLPTAGAPRCLPASWRHVKDITPFRRAADRLNEPLWATVPASHTTYACSRIIRASVLFLTLLYNA